MSRMANPKTIDLDAELGFDLDEKIPTKKVRLLGREWTVAMAEIAAGDASGIAQFIVGIIAEDERADFTAALRSTPNMTGERLGGLLTKLVEVAAERPTELPSPSVRTAKKQTSAPRSRAR
jgi:hypothetical protein